MDTRTYWLITALKTREDTFVTLQKKMEDVDLCKLWKFQIPDLKVGTLDSLMSLSDDLGKIDTTVEFVTRKIANQLMDLLEGETSSNNNSKDTEKDALNVNNQTVDMFLNFFRWDDSKYPQNIALKAITDNIATTVSKMDEELKAKSIEYTNLIRSIATEERAIGGNLLVRDLSDIITKENIVDSEFMESVFVVVNKNLYKSWEENYERLTQYVVPRSSQKIHEDSDFGLFSVILMKKFADDFKNKAREMKFNVRDFKFDPNRSAKGNKKKMEAEKDDKKKKLIRWCKVNFAEAFQAWIHLKAIRAFVESVLRYGLPTNFQAILLLPHKGKEKKLRTLLFDQYGHLGSKLALDEKDENEEYFPYVSLEINTEMRNKQI